MYTDDSQATPTAQKYRWYYGLMMDGAMRPISTIKGLYEEFEKWVWVNFTHSDLLGLIVMQFLSADSEEAKNFTFGYMVESFLEVAFKVI